MKRLISIFAFVIVAAAAVAAQPAEAQLRKQLTGPKTVSVSFLTNGKVEWSSSFKKYIWTRYFVKKQRGDAPGEFTVVRGYVAYDIVGGRYVFWREFLSDVSYEGKNPPAAADIARAIAGENLSVFHPGSRDVVEYISFKLAPDPAWEWPTPNSVSFYAVAEYRAVNYGKHYSNASSTPAKPGHRWIDTVREVWRISVSRPDEKSDWNRGSRGTVTVMSIPDGKGAKIPLNYLLERTEVPEKEIDRMPRPTRVPPFTN